MKLRAVLVCTVITSAALATAGDTALAQDGAQRVQSDYAVQPGDRLEISVWNEPDLQREVLVAPDGSISFPLVGQLNVIGKSIGDLRDEFVSSLQRYIEEPLVTVSVSEVLGNKVYVIGEVNRPGEYVVNPMVDVMQALSMAGGATAFASVNDILILRRDGQEQTAIPFRYGDVSSGRNLDLNIVLQSGDVLVVP